MFDLTGGRDFGVRQGHSRRLGPAPPRPLFTLSRPDSEHRWVSVKCPCLKRLCPKRQEPASGIAEVNLHIRADRDFCGKLSNTDLSSSLTVTHIAIDKTAKIQAEIVRAALAIPKSEEGSLPSGSAKKAVAAGKPRRSQAARFTRREPAAARA
jgi:hypothetical protein